MTSLWNTFSLQSHLGITKNPARQLIHPTCRFQFCPIDLLLEPSTGVAVAKLALLKFSNWVELACVQSSIPALSPAP